MSAIVKTATPFLNLEILCQALEEQGVNISLQGDTIVCLNRQDYYGQQKFQLNNGRYALLHDSSRTLRGGIRSNQDFLNALEESYNRLWNEQLSRLEAERLEAERQRLEQERIAYVQSQKQRIIEKAQAKGYTVKEVKKANKIQLVLIKNTY